MTASLEFDTFCISCMQDKGIHEVRCPYCGYDERKYKDHPLYLKPRILLKNQYIIGKSLGQGGFGITYMGLDKWLQKKVAIKEYLPSALATRDFLTSSIIAVKKQEDAFQQGLHLFIQEARHLAKFNHPNIVKVINFFEENQTGYMVMEYLEGDSPEHILTQAGGRLPVANALAIILPILEALAEVHAHHLYHCDISAQNIRVLTTGIPILIDFGAARHRISEHSRSLALVLKHGYSPLEQYSGRGKIGPWTDIYACGALLYLLVTGTLPPAATDRFGEDTLIAPATMPGIDISIYVNQAIIRALAIKLEERFQTVAEFKAALTGKEMTPVVTTVATNQWHPHQRRLGIKTLLVAGLLMVIVGGIWSYFVHEPSQSIQQLLAQAQQQLAAEKWLAPQGDNAYHTYQKILQMEPDNVPAKTGILTIIDQIYQLARLKQEKGQLTDSLQWVQQGLQLSPTHVGLLELETTLKEQQRLAIQAQEIQSLLGQATDSVSQGQLEMARTLYQQILTLDAHHAAAMQGLQQVADRYEQLARQEMVWDKQLNIVKQGLMQFPTHAGLLSLQRNLTAEKLAQQQRAEEQWAKQRKLTELLKTAQQQISTLRLTEPAGDNAYDTYQTVLNLDPNNSEAKAGLVKIADEYERLARIRQDHVEKNLAWIDKGLMVSPTHPGLLALRQTIMQEMTKAPAVSMISAKPKPTPATVVPLPINPLASLLPPPKPSKKENSSRPPEPPPAPRSANRETIEVRPVIKSPVNHTQSAPTMPKPTTVPKVATVMATPVVDPVMNLLTQANQQLNAQQWEAATKTYQQLLTLVPNHPIAKNGLQQIVQHYEQLARQQAQAGHFSDSLTLINQGLAINPNQPGLLTLQQEVSQRLQNTLTPSPKEPKTSPGIIFAPTF